jgi:hypothetical protein
MYTYTSLYTESQQVGLRPDLMQRMTNLVIALDGHEGCTQQRQLAISI